MKSDRFRTVPFVKKHLLPLAFAFAFSLAPLFGQDILTADQFFLQVSERYAQVSDYEGKLGIVAGKSSMSGLVAYKAPTLLRIDFVQPPDQVIVFDGTRLVIYIPDLRAVLQQDVSGKPTGAASLATREGLRMLRRNYSIAYETSPTPLPLDEGSAEEVVRLSLTRRVMSEGFKSLKLSITPDTKIIRRIEGLTLSNERFVFDFTGIKLNTGIPETRFIYDSPASANVYNNFLFGSDN